MLVSDLLGTVAQPTTVPFAGESPAVVGAAPTTVPFAGETPHPFAANGLLPYISPTARIQQQTQLLQNAGLNPGQVTATLAQQANAYAANRIKQLQAVKQYLTPELQQMLSVSGTHPGQNWGNISSAWTNLAKSQGYADPRLWLRDAAAGRLPAVSGSAATAPANPTIPNRGQVLTA